MNKIKLMYSIAKTMKEKDHFNGSLQVECIKDPAKLFQMTNEFSKDLSSGMAKARIKTEMDYAGKSFKHESSNEFSHTQNLHRHESFFKGRHARFHHGHCMMKELHALENPNLVLLATINKKNELECIDLKLSGKQAGGLEENHTLNINAKLILSNK